MKTHIVLYLAKIIHVVYGQTLSVISCMKLHPAQIECTLPVLIILITNNQWTVII